MARKILKRIIPSPESIKKYRSLEMLGDWLHDPNIWHLNRKSVSAAAFIGLFVAFIPLPGQTLIAAFLAIMLRVNLPISILLVWITNPLTMAPIFYLSYKVGAAIMGTAANQFNFEISWYWLTNGLAQIWQPFLLGCLLCGTFSGLLASAAVRWAWRKHTIHRWHERRLQRKN